MKAKVISATHQHEMTRLLNEFIDEEVNRIEDIKFSTNSSTVAAAFKLHALILYVPKQKRTGTCWGISQ